VADRAAEASYEVVCPHCGKPFEGELLTASSTPRARGFKCPHCRLFVPFERANGEPLADGSD
jgi:DNA-directed RNA polymerase subunit RPC12/RpoP